MGTGQRLGELLLAKGQIHSEQLERALSSQVVHGARIGTNLVEQGALSIDGLTAALAEQHCVPAVESEPLEQISPEILAIVPHAVAARHCSR